MPKKVKLKDLTPFKGVDIDSLVDQHFPEGSWCPSESLIEDYPYEKDTYTDIYSVFGSDAFEQDYGTDPIGCVYVTHDNRVFFISYL